MQQRNSPAFTAIPGRRLPLGWRIYAIGDVHGRVDLLDPLLVQLHDDLTRHPCGSVLIVFLGDYIDRGPASAEVIERLLAVKEVWPVVCLMGNHESYALRFLDDPAILSRWIEYGGRETLRSYGLAAPARPDARHSELLARDFETACGPHLGFLSSLPSSFSFGDFFFCHAGVRPGTTLAWQTPDDLMTIREPFLSHDGEYGKLVVHGHTPDRRPVIRHNRIGIDTAAYLSSRLTCLVIEDEAFRFL